MGGPPEYPASPWEATSLLTLVSVREPFFPHTFPASLTRASLLPNSVLPGPTLSRNLTSTFLSSNLSARMRALSTARLHDAQACSHHPSIQGGLPCRTSVQNVVPRSLPVAPFAPPAELPSRPPSRRFPPRRFPPLQILMPPRNPPPRPTSHTQPPRLPRHMFPSPCSPSRSRRPPAVVPSRSSSSSSASSSFSDPGRTRPSASAAGASPAPFASKNNGALSSHPQRHHLCRLRLLRRPIGPRRRHLPRSDPRRKARP